MKYNNFNYPTQGENHEQQISKKADNKKNQKAKIRNFDSWQSLSINRGISLWKAF